MAIQLIFKRNPLKAILFILCLVGLLSVSAGLFAGQDEQATSPKHCLWMVETPLNKQIFLLGSLHFLKSNAYPLANVIYTSYNRSQKIVFEVDLRAVLDPTVQAKMRELGLYPEGQTIFENIPDELQRPLKKKMAELGMAMEHFGRFRPWYLAVTMTALELQRLGYSTAYGIDDHFFNKADSDQKEIGFLETFEFQFNLLADLNPSEQSAFLSQTLQDLEVVSQMADDMLEYWKKGDIGQLYAILLKTFKDYPQIENRLLHQRNKEWVQKIEKMMGENKNIFIVAGAGHFIGPGSVVAILQEKGYEVQQK